MTTNKGHIDFMTQSALRQHATDRTATFRINEIRFIRPFDRKTDDETGFRGLLHSSPAPVGVGQWKAENENLKLGVAISDGQIYDIHGGQPLSRLGAATR